MWSLQSLNAIKNFSVHTAKEEVPSAISILQISTLEGGSGLLLLGSVMPQSNDVCAILPCAPCGLELQEEESNYCIKKNQKNGNKSKVEEATTLHAAVASEHGKT